MGVRLEMSNAYLKLTAQSLTRDTSQVPRHAARQAGGDRHVVVPILTTSYCQDPSSTDQDLEVIEM